ncbi:hypothetical protein U1Q18_000407 [Sarracenia purpurea var. burkii]
MHKVDYEAICSEKMSLPTTITKELEVIKTGLVANGLRLEPWRSWYFTNGRGDCGHGRGHTGKCGDRKYDYCGGTNHSTI